MIMSKDIQGFQNGLTATETPQFTITETCYLVTIAKNDQDVKQALKLRYEVFKKEIQARGDGSDREELEMDDYDPQCYHLIVKHRGSGRVVGTYRLQSWEMANIGIGFYANNQFDISGIPNPFLKQSIEIGRGCIHKDHRNGRVLYMLWKGLAAALIGMSKTTLLGCCSLFSRNHDEGLFLMNSLEERKYVARGLKVSARQDYKCFPSKNFDSPVAVPKIPLLFQKYLDFGAKVCSDPAIDREFGSIDYLVMLHFHQMDPHIYRFFTRDVLLQTG
jgi:putative hemolysin